MFVRVGLVFLVGSFLLFFIGMSMVIDGVAVYLDYGVSLMSGFDFWLGFIFDWVSVFFYSVVMMISGLIMIYCVEYMEGDSSSERFSYMMVGFVLSMGLVVFSSNLVMLLFGWDGLGLVSFCLVVYYQNGRSLNAGMLTILSNRVGDVGLIGCLGLVMGCGGGGYVEGCGGGMEWGDLMVLMILLAGLTKSAQIPFSAWLPAAMAAPTPVSSLVHSSTLVAAGVYLMIRFSLNLGMWGGYLFFLGTLTMFMAGVGANYETDFSSVIALSTLSQLGLMMMIVSLGGWMLAYFHMVIHALFKAMMFMCAGAVIHGMGGNQDVRFVGGLIGYSPFVGMGFSCSMLALMGFPFFAGFYSKDLILESEVFSGLNMFMGVMIILSFALTVSYSMSLGYCSMWGSGWVGLGLCSWGEGKIINCSIIFLVFMSIVGGAVVSWMLLPFGEVFILGFWEKLLGVVIVCLGIWVFLVWGKSNGWSGVGFSSLEGMFVSDFLGKMWFMGVLSGNPIISILGWSAVFKSGDEIWGEIVGGGGLSNMVLGGVSVVDGFQGVSLSDYFVVVAMTMIIVLCLFF
uniref:NADH-ubiquinone oxidoreductase chain 5 n=1 Tax=Damon diadema TaxID=317680 RepID=B5U6K6_9ARAC|nr:NADH dehydrogenase subunit 5 [Damon diadema]ACI02274.1 NADH dehydrogenase subunit 5 [Damon diadema]